MDQRGFPGNNQQQQGQRLQDQQQNRVSVTLSRAFLSRHERPPAGPNTSTVVGAGGIVGNVLHAAPVSSVIAISGLIRASIIANIGSQGSLLGSFVPSSLAPIYNAITSILPPPFTLLSFRPTGGSHSSSSNSRLGSAVMDTSADTVTAISITLLLWWIGRPAERRWGPGRFLTYLLVGYFASMVAFFVASTLFATPLTMGSSLWMAPSVALLLNSLLLQSRPAAGPAKGGAGKGSVSLVSTLLSNAFSFRGIASLSLLSYALLLNVTGGVLGNSTAASYSSSASGMRARYGLHASSAAATAEKSSGVSIIAALASLAPFILAGALQFYLASPQEALIGGTTTAQKSPATGGTEVGGSADTAKPQLPPQSREGSPALDANKNINKKKNVGSTSPLESLRSSLQRFLYATVVCPRFVQPILFRLVYANGNKSNSQRQDEKNKEGETDKPAKPSAQQGTTTQQHRNFQRRVIKRLEEIGYTRAGTLMTDDEEVLYAAQLQGMVPMLNRNLAPPPTPAMARRAGEGGVGGAVPAAAPAVDAAAAGPLTPAQRDKVNTLLEIGLPGVDAQKARQALASVGWDMDTAMTLLMEQM